MTEIAILGDSITQGFPGRNYPDLIAEALGPDVTVVNRGVSGATLTNGTDLPIRETDAFAALLESEPDIVLVMLGTNDTKPEFAETSRTAYGPALEALIETLREIEGQPDIVLATPPPLSAKDPAREAVVVEAFVPAIEAAAADWGLPLIDVHGGVDDYPDAYPDAVHPSLEGMQTLAELMAGPLAAAIAALGDGVGDGLAPVEARTVALLYEAVLDRDGAIDTRGLNFWIDRREAGLSEHDVAEQLITSAEFAAKAGKAALEDDRAYVEAIYLSTLDRPGEERGIAFWLRELERPDFDRADLALAFAESAENVARSPHVETLAEIAPGVWDFA